MRLLTRTALLATAILGVLVADVGAAGASSSSSARTRVAGLRATLGTRMHQVGGSSGAYVYDLTAGRRLFALRGGVARIPASVEKLYSASTALLGFGGPARLATEILGRGKLTPDGVFQGNLYLRGGGDPTFGSAAYVRAHYGAGATVEALARALRRAGISHVHGRLIADESLFDNRRGGPSAGYRLDPFLTGELSALAYDRGATGTRSGQRAHSPALFAGRALLRALRRRGVSVSGPVATGRTARGAVVLASEPSPAMRLLVRLTLSPSDNFFAEMLLKDLGARFGARGSTAAGAAVVRARMARLGLHPRVLDGSGLSRGDHTSPADVVGLLTAMREGPEGADLFGDLAVAGHSGTLVRRMRGTPAAGRCRAKTGSLSDVSALAGFCRAADGHLLVFAFLMNRVSVDAARAVQDAMAVALARY